MSPSEALKHKVNNIPDFVFEAVNSVLARHLNAHGTYATFKQDTIIAEIQRLQPDVRRQEIYDNRWLDFEPAYREAGWQVTYDKPAYNETYAANWKFQIAK